MIDFKEFVEIDEFQSSIIETNIYRVGSEKYFEVFNEYRKMYENNMLHNISDIDRQILETDIGEFAIYEGNHVPLDCPMIEEEKDVELNKPKKGGPKKYYVYVKDPKTGKVRKINFGHGGTSAKKKGEKTMKIRKSNPKARKNFRARHNCADKMKKKDVTSAGYWSCKKW